MRTKNENSKIAKALLETAHALAGRDEVLSDESRTLLESFTANYDQKIALLFRSELVRKAPLLAKQTIAQSFQAYCLLYELAYGDLSPRQHLKILKTLWEMAESDAKFLQEVAPILAGQTKEDASRRDCSAKEEKEREERKRRAGAFLKLMEKAGLGPNAKGARPEGEDAE